MEITREDNCDDDHGAKGHQHQNISISSPSYHKSRVNLFIVISQLQGDCCQFLFLDCYWNFISEIDKEVQNGKNASIPFVKEKPTFNESCVSRAEKPVFSFVRLFCWQPDFLLQDSFGDKQTRTFCLAKYFQCLKQRQGSFVWEQWKSPLSMHSYWQLLWINYR